MDRSQGRVYLYSANPPHLTDSLFDFSFTLHVERAAVDRLEAASSDFTMAYRYDNDSDPEKRSPSDEARKPPLDFYETAPDDPNRLSDPTDAGHSLHRGLAARQVSMIAIGEDALVHTSHVMVLI